MLIKKTAGSANSYNRILIHKIEQILRGFRPSDIRRVIVSLFFAAAVAADGGRAEAHAFSDNPVSPAAALDAYRKMADDNPADVELQYDYAEMLVSAGELDEAERIIVNRVNTAAPDYDAGYDLLSEVYFRRGDFEKALEPLQKIKGKDAMADALVDEASIYLKLENPDVSLEKARAAIKSDRSNPGGFLVAALAWQAKGDARKAMRLMEVSLRIDPCQPMAYDWLLGLYEDNRASAARRLAGLEIVAFGATGDGDCAARLRGDIDGFRRAAAKKPAAGNAQ